MYIIIKDLFRHDFRFAFAVIVLLMLLLLSLVSYLSPHHSEARHVVERDLVPSLQHPLGTNSRGQDIFWLISHSIRNSLIMGGLTAIMSISIGTFVGLIAGYKGGLIDKILMTVNELNRFACFACADIGFSDAGRYDQFDDAGFYFVVFFMALGWQTGKIAGFKLKGERIHLYCRIFRDEHDKGGGQGISPLRIALGYGESHKYHFMGNRNGNNTSDFWTLKSGNSDNRHNYFLGIGFPSYIKRKVALDRKPDSRRSAAFCLFIYAVVKHRSFYRS